MKLRFYLIHPLHIKNNGTRFFYIYYRINGVIKMKKIGFKKLLLALMLLPTFVTAGTVLNECNTGFWCNHLGFLYEKGKGVKQDVFKAVEFYQKACGLNDDLGCFNLGFMPIFFIFITPLMPKLAPQSPKLRGYLN
jgi:hypothetical protein